MTQVTHSSDVIVIGGGPAGATASALIAQAGYEVSLLEAQTFPRFHVGESLIPAVNLTLDRLGVLDQMDGHGFPNKHGVQFYSPKGAGRPFYFSEATDPRMHQTWQVLRSDFDAMLLDKAVENGVTTFMGTRALEARRDGDRITGIRATNGHDEELTFDAPVVIDASGQNGVVARRLGRRTGVPDLENLAVFAHYRDARLDDGIDAGSTLIFRLEAKSWLWFIPLPGVVSVGLVAPSKTIWSYGDEPESVLDAAIGACPHLMERLDEASRTTDVHVARDFSYVAQQEGGEGWLLAGDALGFIDPVYSSGLFLAVYSAELAADAVDDAFKAGGPPRFESYAASYRSAWDRFLSIVRAFYTEGFHFGPLAKDADGRQGLVDILTGDVGTPSADRVARAISATLGG